MVARDRVMPSGMYGTLAFGQAMAWWVRVGVVSRGVRIRATEVPNILLL